MKKKYVVTLTDEERGALHVLVPAEKGAARKLAHVRILLKSDARRDGLGWTDAAISEAVDVGTATVERVRRRFVEEGIESALVPRRSTRQYGRKLDSDGEAHLFLLLHV